MLISDAADWEQALQADQRAFGVLFDRHHDRVFRHAVRLVVEPADADEVMASAFFELWRRRDSVHLVEGSVLPWLLATATYLSRNRVRGLLRYRAVLNRLPREAAADAAETATARLEQRELRRRFAAALREVSRTDAALLTLTLLDGLSPAAAAEVVGLTPGAARTRLYRARGRLRDLLADLHDEPGLPEGLDR